MVLWAASRVSGPLFYILLGVMVDENRARDGGMKGGLGSDPHQSFKRSVCFFLQAVDVDVNDAESLFRPSASASSGVP